MQIVSKLPLSGLKWLLETNELAGTEFHPITFWEHCTHAAFPGFSVVAVELEDTINRAWILPSWIPGIELPPDIPVQGRPDPPKTFLVVASSIKPDVKSTLLRPDTNWPHYSAMMQSPPAKWFDRWERFLQTKTITIHGRWWQRLVHWLKGSP